MGPSRGRGAGYLGEAGSCWALQDDPESHGGPGPPSPRPPRPGALGARLDRSAAPQLPRLPLCPPAGFSSAGPGPAGPYLLEGRERAAERPRHAAGPGQHRGGGGAEGGRTPDIGPGNNRKRGGPRHPPRGEGCSERTTGGGGERTDRRREPVPPQHSDLRRGAHGGGGALGARCAACRPGRGLPGVPTTVQRPGRPWGLTPAPFRRAGPEIGAGLFLGPRDTAPSHLRTTGKEREAGTGFELGPWQTCLPDLTRGWPRAGDVASLSQQLLKYIKKSKSQFPASLTPEQRNSPEEPLKGSHCPFTRRRSPSSLTFERTPPDLP